MKRILFRTFIVAVAAALLLVVAFGQAQAPQVPFFTTPALSAYSSSSGITLLVSLSAGSYTPFRFSSTPPYGMLSSIQTLAGIIFGVTKLSAATPPGPPAFGLASQYAAIGDLKGDDSPAGAYINPAANNPTQITVLYATDSGVYSGSKSYTVGAQAVGVIAADFNRDGTDDLAVVYAGSYGTSTGGVAILLNNGDGTFAPAVSYAAGSSPISVAALDVNHDGILDLAVADNGSSPGKVFVLLGKGNGTFGTAVGYSAGKNPLSVTIADFNGDGNPDLAVTAADNSLTILLGNGNGTFRSGSSYATGSNPQYVAAGDLNGDGKLDLVVANGGAYTVSVYLGKGDGTFQAGSSYVVSYEPASLILTDYNGDGNLDIIQGTGNASGLGPAIRSGNIDILLGNGDGTFQGTVAYTVSNGALGALGTFLATGDFNGDGKLDAIMSDQNTGNLYLFAGDGKGAFQSPATLTALASSGPTGAAAADFNGDGKLDLAVTEQGAGKIATLLNSASGLQLSGTFSSGGAEPGPIVAADFNGDGKLDLAVANSPSDDRTTPGNLTIFFGAGNGTFQLAHTYSAGSWPYALAVADLNGDGKPDLVVVDRGDPFLTPRPNGALYVFLNDGHGGFQTPLTLTDNAYPYLVYIADLNGDGKPDLVVGAESATVTYTLDVLLGVGNGTFQAPVTVSKLYSPSGVVARDFNGDGKVDLVVSHCCGATDVTYMQGTGDGTFQAEVHFNGGANPFSVAAGDLNGDGKPDLIIGGRSLTALLNNQAATVATTIATSPAGLAITVDGTAYTAPQTFNWTAGTSHSIGVTSPQGAGTRYAFATWSDSGAETHNLTTPAAATTYTANFTAQYLLTMQASPTAGGSITASPSSTDGYYTSGTVVQLTPVAANCEYQFTNWSGDVAGTANPQSIAMSAPHTVTASFNKNRTFSDNGFFVCQQYLDLLGRAPDTSGYNYWVGLLNGGQVTRGQVADAYFVSPEFQGDGFFIISAYIAVLGRNPDYAGWLYWLNNLWAGVTQQQVIDSFIQSTEFQQTYGTLNNTAFVTLVYQNVLGHAPDPAGLTYWVGQLNAGVTRSQCMYSFATSTEFQNSIQNQALATLLYMGFLRRSPDPTGVAYWTGQLNYGIPAATVLTGFITSAEYIARF